MEIITVTSISEIKGIINSARNPSYTLQFRGQGCDNCDWKLRPSIVHQLDIQTVAEFKNQEFKLIEKFKKKIANSNCEHRILQASSPTGFQNEWLWLFQAQHYRLPTRIMDWSLDWKRALYFSLNEPKHDSSDGQLWIYQSPIGNDLSEHLEGYLNVDPYNIVDTAIIIPSYHIVGNQSDYIASERQFHQMSRFLIQPDEESLVPFEENHSYANNLIKLIIPANSKSLIKNFIDPDIDGEEFFYIEEDSIILEIIRDIKQQFLKPN